jgi:hypothetical protein
MMRSAVAWALRASVPAAFWLCDETYMTNSTMMITGTMNAAATATISCWGVLIGP